MAARGAGPLEWSRWGGGRGHHRGQDVREAPRCGEPPDLLVRLGGPVGRRGRRRRGRCGSAAGRVLAFVQTDHPDSLPCPASPDCRPPEGRSRRGGGHRCNGSVTLGGARSGHERGGSCAQHPGRDERRRPVDRHGLALSRTPGPADARSAPSRRMDRIRQSIEQILDTEPGERIMLPEFGCGLRRYLMEPNTLTTRSAIQRDIEQALIRWEPRIQLTGVSVTARRRALGWSGWRSPTSCRPTYARTTSSTRSTSGADHGACQPDPGRPHLRAAPRRAGRPDPCYTRGVDRPQRVRSGHRPAGALRAPRRVRAVPAQPAPGDRTRSSSSVSWAYAADPPCPQGCCWPQARTWPQVSRCRDRPRPPPVRSSSRPPGRPRSGP